MSHCGYGKRGQDSISSVHSRISQLSNFLNWGQPAYESLVCDIQIPHPTHTPWHFEIDHSATYSVGFGQVIPKVPYICTCISSHQSICNLTLNAKSKYWSSAEWILMLNLFSTSRVNNKKIDGLVARLIHVFRQSSCILHKSPLKMRLSWWHYAKLWIGNLTKMFEYN